MIIIWTNGVANPFQSMDTNGIWNGIKSRAVTLEDIFDKLCTCCAEATQLAIINQTINLGNQTTLGDLVARLDAHDGKFSALLSAIFDLRRELLRGNRDIRR